MSTLSVDTIQGKTTASKVIMPTGHVLQVAHNITHDTAHISTTSTSLVASGISVSITPKASGNKILVEFFSGMSNHDTSGDLRPTLYIDGSIATGVAQYWGGYVYYTSASQNERFHPLIAKYIYDTVDTNSHTFEVYFRVTSGTGYISHADSSNGITATEIQA